MRKPRFIRRIPRFRRASKPGTQPGTITVDPESPKPTIEVFAYGPDAFVEQQNTNAAAVRSLLGKWPVVWVNVMGLGDSATLSDIGELVGMHPLALEDVANLHQRPKVEPYEHQVFIVARMVHLTDEVTTEQVSMVLGKDFLITFQERPGDCFDSIRQRIRNGQGKVRKAGPCFLAYLLLDSIVDAFFPVLEQYGERLEALDAMVDTPNQKHFTSLVHGIKHDLLVMRRAIWPQRDALASLLRDDSPLFAGETRVYMRDVADHAVQVLDMLETYRELAAGLLDIHLSSISNRMNDVMKVLTVIATIFIPITFIAGLYGMNLQMPEYQWKWAYPVVLFIMVMIAVAMLFYFRWRGWLGGNGGVPTNSGPANHNDSARRES